MFNFSIYSPEDYKSSSWSGGTTTELFIYPPEGDYASRNFAFRLSSAQVDLPESNFSDLPDFHRIIASLENPLLLEHPERAEVRLLMPYELYSFEGAWQTKSRGQTRDFNLIYKDSWQARAICLEEPGSALTLLPGVQLFGFSPQAQRLELNLGQPHNPAEDGQRLECKLAALGLLHITTTQAALNVEVKALSGKLLILLLEKKSRS